MREVMMKDRDGSLKKEGEVSYGYYDSLVGSADEQRNILIQQKEIQNKYAPAHLPIVEWTDRWQKMIGDCLIVTKNEPKEWRIKVLYWCRKVANADWEFESALGNISKKEMDMLQRFHKELGVSWEEVPQQL